MIICPICSNQQPSDDTKFCGFCGGELPQKYNADDIDEETDFQVSETPDNGVEFLDSKNPKEKIAEEDLGVESNADLLETRADKLNQKLDEDDGLIGQSWPPVASYLEEYENEQNTADNELKLSKLKKNTEIESTDREVLKNKLVEFENNINNIKNINKPAPKVESEEVEQSIPDNTKVKNDEEVEQFILDNTKVTNDKVEVDKIDDVPSPPQKVLESISDKPKISPRSRGIAYFYKNYIQLAGKQALYPDDEIEVGNRLYVLKPKKIRPSILYGGIAALFILLIIYIGSFYMGNTSGYGEIVGFVLDEYDQPYTESATIKFSDLGKEVTSNPRGFFQLENVPVGPTRIEYLIDGEVLKIDYVTVTAENTSTILLFPDADKSTYSNDQNNNYKNSTSNENITPDYQSNSGNAVKSNNKSKVLLSANVQNARLELDGKVIGSGNITYRNITPGVHSYKVSQDGYNSVEGSFHVNAGNTKKLNVTLIPLQSAEKEDIYDVNDYYFSAKNLAGAGKYKEAIEDYTKALKIDPSFVKAVLGRAKAYSLINDDEHAHDDYIRAAEIYQFDGDLINSQTAYGNAIRLNPNSVTAYLGRGNLFLNSKAYRAALGDFDKVTKLDRRNFDAYYGMGVATFEQQRYRSAINHFSDARSINDKNPLIYQYLMLSYMYLNDEKNLKKNYSKFLDTASDEQLAEFRRSNNYSTIERFVN